jgi:hypothetical protein
MKDVPMECPEGLAITTICEREDPTDAFVSNRFATLMTCHTVQLWEHQACAVNVNYVLYAPI